MDSTLALALDKYFISETTPPHSIMHSLSICVIIY